MNAPVLIVVIILIIVIIAIVLIWFKERKKLLNEISDLKNQNQELSKFKEIINVEQHCKQMTADAYQSTKEIIINANKQKNSIITDAEKQADTIISNSKKEINELNYKILELKNKLSEDIKVYKLKTEKVLSDATSEAQRIIEESKKKAAEIAGEAYEIAKNSKLYEQTAIAMKNIIKGYGDEYLVPTYGLLDDLAKEFGFTDAGNKLSLAREQSKLMIKKGIAAKCEYVEANRKDTAINFVIDAFNGKVDTILTNVKQDNFGILAQKIRDAYSIVNSNGIAFRNARITDEYLTSRLDELKWAVIVTELKMKEREEQRLIKERIREEEKARKEFEKAMRDAEKEEEIIKKAIEKAQKEINQAKDENKAKYEEQLRQLNDKLKLAEEKNKRAISMAQQTKSGHVYIISNVGSFGEDVFKIGMTRRLEPLDRVKELGDASVPFEFDVHAMIYSEDAPKLENELHKNFIQMQMNKVNPRKEFFKVNISSIKKQFDKLGINAKWTLTAEAKEFRESLAIEKAIMNDKKKQEEWIKSQQELEKNMLSDEDLQLN